MTANTNGIDERITKDVDYIMLSEKEKKARLENEISQDAALCVEMVNFAWTKYGLEHVPSVFQSLSKKRNQSKKSQSEMIKTIFDSIYPSSKNQEEQIKILKSIIEVTEGKIYVEYEYSLAIRKLTEILLSQGNIEEAAKMVQDIQIETFGSLQKVYKVEYILFQMKILIQKGDFIRTLIVSNKVIRKNLDEAGLENLKIVFYLLMAKYNIHEDNFLEAGKNYQVLYDYYQYLFSNKEKIDDSNLELVTSLSNISAKDLFEKFIYYINISPPNELMKEKIAEVKDKYSKELEEYPILGALISLKSGDDIVGVTEQYLSQFNTQIFTDNEEFFVQGTKNAKLFRKYVIQHNLSIFHKFYSQVTMKRISELISIGVDEVESEICDMVMNKYVYAKINRIRGTVSFRPKQTNERKSDSLNDDLFKMLETLEQTCHLIHKENLKYGIKTK